MINWKTKKTKALLNKVISNLKANPSLSKIPAENDLPHSCIVGAIHINESFPLSKNKNLKNNKWAIGPICSLIDKKIAFKNSIRTNGMINLGWSFESMDAKNKKMGRFDGKLKEKVEKELNFLLECLQNEKNWVSYSSNKIKINAK